MRFSCTRTALKDGIQIATRASPTRSNLAILANVLLEAAGENVILTCYDGDMGIRVQVPAQVEAGGDATAPARLFAEVVGNLPEAQIAASSDERFNVRLACEKTEFTLAGLPAQDFPRLPVVGSETRLTLPAPLLREIIKQTIFSVAVDVSRAAITGVFFRVGDGKLTAVSTDLHRLSVREAEAPEMEGEEQAIIPRAALEQFIRAIPADAEETVTMSISHNQAMLECREVTIISRLVEGNFPLYERVLPSGFEKLLVAEREPFLRAVRRVAIVARSEQSQKMILRAAGDVLQLSAENVQLGRAYEEIPITREGEEVELAFNSKYLLEALSVFEGESIRLEVSGHLTPCVLRAEGSENYRHILVPMQM